MSRCCFQLHNWIGTWSRRWSCQSPTDELFSADLLSQTTSRGPANLTLWFTNDSKFWHFLFLYFNVLLWEKNKKVVETFANFCFKSVFSGRQHFSTHNLKLTFNSAEITYVQPGQTSTGSLNGTLNGSAVPSLWKVNSFAPKTLFVEKSTS